MNKNISEKKVTGKGKKGLKEIMNRTRFDKYELEEFMLTEGGFE